MKFWQNAPICNLKSIRPLAIAQASRRFRWSWSWEGGCGISASQNIWYMAIAEAIKN